MKKLIIVLLAIVLFTCKEIPNKEKVIRTHMEREIPPTSKIIETLNEDWIIIEFRNKKYLFYSGYYDEKIMIRMEE
jgi:hypothetical protein